MKQPGLLHKKFKKTGLVVPTAAIYTSRLLKCDILMDMVFSRKF